MTLAASSQPLCQHYDLAMLDLDGVVYIGADAVPGADSALAAAQDAGMALAYVTNNASRPPADIAQHLRELGMPGVKDTDVVTSAQAVAHLISNTVPQGSQILVVGGLGLYEALEERGLRGVDALGPDVVAVVQGFHPNVGWQLLAEGTYAVSAGLPWFASNLDMSVPTPRGIAPGNGALVQVIAGATGKRPVVAGKPEAALFAETTERVGGDKPLVVGDRLDTDIEGAANVGVDSLAVLTGVSDLQSIADAEGRQRPSFVSPDLRGLLVAHPAVEVDGDIARCGQSSVELKGGAVRLVTEGDEIGTIRAALTLAWTYRDRTGKSAGLDGMMGS
ncbi:MAG: HAD-IIA family hydrolase [Actinomycetota bacterium]|nr:HAD-IIA family hydrolase [Actinomycetota bacterium]